MTVSQVKRKIREKDETHSKESHYRDKSGKKLHTIRLDVDFLRKLYAEYAGKLADIHQSAHGELLTKSANSASKRLSRLIPKKPRCCVHQEKGADRTKTTSNQWVGDGLEILFAKEVNTLG